MIVQIAPVTLGAGAPLLARLVELLRIAARPPTPRKKTRPPKASKRRRLDDKKKHGTLKSLRSRPSHD